MLGFSALCLVPLPWLDRRRSRLSTAQRAGTRWPTTTKPSPVAGARVHEIPRATAREVLQAVTPNASAIATLLSATRSVGALELRLLLRSWPLRALLVLWMVMIAIEGDGQMAGGEYGTRMLASSGVLADAVPVGLWLIGTLCALYFAADSVSRERLNRFDGIRDATPVANLALLLGKLAALLLLPVLLTITG